MGYTLEVVSAYLSEGKRNHVAASIGYGLVGALAAVIEVKAPLGSNPFDLFIRGWDGLLAVSTTGLSSVEWRDYHRPDKTPITETEPQQNSSRIN